MFNLQTDKFALCDKFSSEYYQSLTAALFYQKQWLWKTDHSLIVHLYFTAVVEVHKLSSKTIVGINTAWFIMQGDGMQMTGSSLCRKVDVFSSDK